MGSRNRWLLSLLAVSAGACSNSTGPGHIVTVHPAGVLYGTTTLPGRPFALTISSHGVVFVALADSGRIVRSTLPDTGLGQPLGVGDEPTGLAVNPAGNRAYVANQFDRNVDVIDIASNQTVDVLPIVGDPFVMTAAPDGQSLFVSSDVDTIYRIATNHTILGAVGGPATVNALTISPDNVHLYASLPDAGVVQDIAIASNTLTRTFTIPGRPQGLAVSGDGKILYVASETSQFLYLVNTGIGAVSDSIGVSGGGFALALTPDGTQLYLTRSSAGKVTIVTLATRDTVNIAVGGAPRRFAFDATGTYAVVANESGWVDFIR